MAKVKCQYCDSYIDDALEKCNVCGATNEHHRRIADGTPKTIEELQQWYVARNLPPEEITRFFIGKDIKEPKAFGIYKHNGRVTVYKNKANGERAIRYSGTDEAYAVNELYLKLKEVILRQKSLNIKRKKTSTDKGMHKKSKKKKTFAEYFGIGCIVFLCLLVIGIILCGTGVLQSGPAGYFLTDDYNGYYRCEGEGIRTEWWKLNVEKQKWEFYDRLWGWQYPDDIKEGYYTDNYLDLAVIDSNLNVSVLNIWESKEFLDAGHRKTPRSTYYSSGGKVYYFPNDEHSSYGKKDNSGWYLYSTDDNDWSYYCSADDRSLLDDELWYFSEKYSSNASAIKNDLGYNWNVSGEDGWLSNDFKAFEDTEYYASYEENEEAYKKYEENRKNDEDDDYDWDSNDDWDSDDYDWDSDW